MRRHCLALLQLSLAGAFAGQLNRRTLLLHSSAAIGLSQPALAAQRGAEDPFATQLFDQGSVCADRTLLGACKANQAAVKSKPTAAVPLKTLSLPPEPESDLVKKLLEKSAQNADANAQLVKEKTVAAGLSGSYGPFANTIPVMRTDGSFQDISFPRFDRLKDKGKIYKTKTGLDAYVEGFDPDAPEPKQQKMFGIF